MMKLQVKRAPYQHRYQLDAHADRRETRTAIETLMR